MLGDALFRILEDNWASQCARGFFPLSSALVFALFPEKPGFLYASASPHVLLTPQPVFYAVFSFRFRDSGVSSTWLVTVVFLFWANESLSSYVPLTPPQVHKCPLLFSFSHESLEKSPCALLAMHRTPVFSFRRLLATRLYCSVLVGSKQDLEFGTQLYSRGLCTMFYLPNRRYTSALYLTFQPVFSFRHLFGRLGGKGTRFYLLHAS